MSLLSRCSVLKGGKKLLEPNLRNTIIFASCLEVNLFLAVSSRTPGSLNCRPLALGLPYRPLVKRGLPVSDSRENTPWPHTANHILRSDICASKTAFEKGADISKLRRETTGEISMADITNTN
jgi:hypothetical protein